MVGRYVVQGEGKCPDTGAVANPHGAENLRSRPEHDAVANDGSTRPAVDAHRHTVFEHYALTEYGIGMHDETEAVLDLESRTRLNRGR